MMLERPAMFRGPFTLPACLPSATLRATSLQAGRSTWPQALCLQRGAGGMLPNRAVRDAPLWLRFSAGEHQYRKGQSAERGGGEERGTGEV